MSHFFACIRKPKRFCRGRGRVHFRARSSGGLAMIAEVSALVARQHQRMRLEM